MYFPFSDLKKKKKENYVFTTNLMRKKTFPFETLSKGVHAFLDWFFHYFFFFLLPVFSMKIFLFVLAVYLKL